MSYPACGPARSVGIDGQANAAGLRRADAGTTAIPAEEAA